MWCGEIASCTYRNQICGGSTGILDDCLEQGSFTQYIRTKEEEKGQVKCVRLPAGVVGGVQGKKKYAKKNFFELQNLKTFLFL